MRSNGQVRRSRTIIAIGCGMILALSGDHFLQSTSPSLADQQTVSMSRELVDCLRRGDAAQLREILEKDGVVNSRDAEGNTPLMLAALYAAPDCIELLLKRKADVNAINRHGATALVRAATDATKVKLLIDAGAKVDVQTKLGNTPLILAARRHGNSATVKLLLEHKADVKARNGKGVSAMLAGAASGDLEIVRLLLKAGGDVNDQPTPKAPPDMIFAGLRTPLMWAAYNNDVPMMKFLLKHGANPNQGTAFGTPLTQAAWHDNVEATQWLLDQKVKVDVRDFAGYTPLHWAASTESPRADLVKLLLEAKADPHAAGGDTIDAFLKIPQTPLMLAQKRGDTEIVAALKAKGAKAAPLENKARPPRAIRGAAGAPQITSAIEKALTALQSSALTSRDSFKSHISKQDCFSCHQQFLPMAAVGAARDRAISFDHDAARVLLDRMQTPKMAFDEFDLQPVFHPEPGHSYGYAGFALAYDKVKSGTTTDGLVHYLTVIQGADGRWFNNLPRPPIQTSDVSPTALAIQVLRTYGWEGRRAEFSAAIDRGKKWLWSVKPDNHEEAVYQLLGLHWAGEPAAKLAPLADSLVKQQRADGGWAQLPKLDSDAYATGQALYALAIVGQPVTGETWQRGLRYLFATREDDGTWKVARRAFPFQPTMTSGFVHGRDAWISASATSWAVLALTQTLPSGQTAAHKPLPVVKTATKPAPKAKQVDFVQHVKPLLERSCIACHSGEKARSHFRVDSREAMLKPGATGKPGLVPGQSTRSPLLTYVSDGESDMEMPPLKWRHRYPALTSEERSLLRAWIDQGAAWPKDVKLEAATRD